MKKTNKGFSLVELIIVIAIMAILAGAIAPALIKYIDKSRKSNDVSSAKTIKTAVETALGTESVYELLVNDTGSIINIKPNQPAAAMTTSTAANASITIDSQASSTFDDSSCCSEEEAKYLIGSNIGETTPKIKYKKATEGEVSITPDTWCVSINAKGTVVVGLSNGDLGDLVADDGAKDGTDFIELAPDINDNYQ